MGNSTCCYSVCCIFNNWKTGLTTVGKHVEVKIKYKLQPNGSTNNRTIITPLIITWHFQIWLIRIQMDPKVCFKGCSVAEDSVYGTTIACWCHSGWTWKPLTHTLTDHNNCYEQTLNNSNALGGCLSAVMAPIAPAVHVVVVGVVSRLGERFKFGADYLGNSL